MQKNKAIIALMFAGCIAILATAMNYHVNSPNNHTATKAQMPPTNMGSNTGAGMGGMEGMSGQMPPEMMAKMQEQGQMPPNMGGMTQGQSSEPQMNMSKLFNSSDVDPTLATRAGELMQQMQVNPNNADVVLELALLFLEADDYLAMLNFSNRASALDPSSAKAAYLAAIAHSQLGEAEAAASEFERSITLQENPATRYGLAVLYIYNLNDPIKGKLNLEEGLKYPELPEDLRVRLQTELDALNTETEQAIVAE